MSHSFIRATQSFHLNKNPLNFSNQLQKHNILFGGETILSLNVDESFTFFTEALFPIQSIVYLLTRWIPTMILLLFDSLSQLI